MARSLTLEQLRAASEAGGVSGVTLKAQGGTFLVQIETRSGGGGVLAKARSTEPRRFGNPAAALNVLRGIGITIGRFDAREWNPDVRPSTAGGRGRAAALREAHRAAAHNKWLAAEIQEAIDDRNAGLAHGDVMAEMDAAVAGMNASSRPAGRKRP